jgi:hypothetical protein
MNRWKVLPHRLNDGRCRDCGRHVAATAPDTCCRCAIERYKDLGHPTIANPVNAFELHGREMWRLPAIALRSGEMRSGMFYPWIGHADGGTLERPLDELLDNGREVAHASVAHETALDLTRRYSQVWVLTTVGGWDMRPLPSTKGSDHAW